MVVERSANDVGSPQDTCWGQAGQYHVWSIVTPQPEHHHHHHHNWIICARDYTDDQTNEPNHDSALLDGDEAKVKPFM